MYLGYCELFHPEMHGYNSSSTPDIEGYFITIFTIKYPCDYLTSKYSERINFYIKIQTERMKTIKEHRFIRNFFSIQKLSPIPQLMEKKIMKGGESICILKTFWLRCIQRKWKKICNYNKIIAKELKQIKNIKKRELHQYGRKHIGLVGMWYKSFP